MLSNLSIFLKNEEYELLQSTKTIEEISSVSCNENAVKAQTIAEELILPAAKAMVSAVFGEKSSERFKFSIQHL